MKPKSRRRVLLGAASCVTALAGCSSSQEDGKTTGTTATTTTTPTDTTTTTTTTTETTTTAEPPSFEVVSTTGGEYELGSEWPLEFSVANRGEQGGTFKTILQISATGNEWENVTEVSFFVPDGETQTYSQQIESPDDPGTVNFRLTGTDAMWTIRFTRPGSEFQGSTSENTRYVELRYRDYYEHEVERIKEKSETIEYETLNRNAEDLFKEPFHYTGVIIQTIPFDNHQVFLIAIDEDYDKIAYCSWVGDRYIKGDKIEFWGQVLGLETYVTGSGGSNTIPALAIADLDLLN